MSRIKEEVRQLIASNNLRVLRDKSTHKALGISYTEDGLKTIANKMGKYIYFSNVNKLQDISKGKKSDKVYSEKFIPRDFENRSLQTAEMHWVEAALHRI